MSSEPPEQHIDSGPPQSHSEAGGGRWSSSVKIVFRAPSPLSALKIVYPQARVFGQGNYLAEFSSNHNQKHMYQPFKLFRITIHIYYHLF